MDKILHIAGVVLGVLWLISDLYALENYGLPNYGGFDFYFKDPYPSNKANAPLDTSSNPYNFAAMQPLTQTNPFSQPAASNGNQKAQDAPRNNQTVPDNAKPAELQSLLQLLLSAISSVKNVTNPKKEYVMTLTIKSDNPAGNQTDRPKNIENDNPTTTDDIYFSGYNDNYYDNYYEDVIRKESSIQTTTVNNNVTKPNNVSQNTTSVTEAYSINNNTFNIFNIPSSTNNPPLKTDKNETGFIYTSKSIPTESTTNKQQSVTPVSSQIPPNNGNKIYESIFPYPLQSNIPENVFPSAYAPDQYQFDNPYLFPNQFFNTYSNIPVNNNFNPPIFESPNNPQIPPITVENKVFDPYIQYDQRYVSGYPFLSEYIPISNQSPESNQYIPNIANLPFQNVPEFQNPIANPTGQFNAPGNLRMAQPNPSSDPNTNNYNFQTASTINQNSRLVPTGANIFRIQRNRNQPRKNESQVIPRFPNPLYVIPKSVQPLFTPPLNSSTIKPLNASTIRPLNASTIRPLNASTIRPLNASTIRPLNPSTIKPLNTPTIKPLNASTITPLNPSTITPLNASTTKPLNVSTIKPLNTSTNGEKDNIPSNVTYFDSTMTSITPTLNNVTLSEFTTSYQAPNGNGNVTPGQNSTVFSYINITFQPQKIFTTEQTTFSQTPDNSSNSNDFPKSQSLSELNTTPAYVILNATQFMNLETFSPQVNNTNGNSTTNPKNNVTKVTGTINPSSLKEQQATTPVPLKTQTPSFPNAAFVPRPEEPYQPYYDPYEYNDRDESYPDDNYYNNDPLKGLFDLLRLMGEIMNNTTVPVPQSISDSTTVTQTQTSTITTLSPSAATTKAPQQNISDSTTTTQTFAITTLSPSATTTKAPQQNISDSTTTTQTQTSVITTLSANSRTTKAPQQNTSGSTTKAQTQTSIITTLRPNSQTTKAPPNANFTNTLLPNLLNPSKTTENFKSGDTTYDSILAYILSKSNKPIFTSLKAPQNYTIKN